MHVFSPYIQGPIPSGIGPCFFTAGKKDKSKRIIRKTKRKQKTHYYCPVIFWISWTICMEVICDIPPKKRSKKFCRNLLHFLHP